MSTLHVLAPPFAGVVDPAARVWLARGDRLPPAANPRVTTLRSLFHFEGTGLPAAALRHSCHAVDAGASPWLCADPAWIRSEATGARLMGWPIDDLAANEAGELAATLRPLFGDAGVPLAVDAPSEWCVRLPPDAPRAEFTGPVAALGASMIDCLPHGDGGRFWRRLFTEAQVLLHEHPVNVARIAAGKNPVNALWLWGPGALPGSVAAAVQTVASVDDVVRGLGKLGGATRVEPLPEALESSPSSDATLLDLDIAGHPDVLVKWLASFQRWLRTRRFDTIALTFAGGERFRIRHRHRLRFWRKA